MPRKRQMFIRGLEAARQYIIDEDPGYICPVCLEIFRKHDELTCEHVPPRALGGKVLCLLCRSCNSKAGHSIDAAVHERYEAARALRTGSSRRFLQLKVGDLSINATLKRVEDAIDLRLAAKHNNPASASQFMSQIHAAKPGTRLHVWYPNRFNDHYALVGYLKIAYLYAFAKFGYGYILRHCLDSVRAQLREPRTRKIWKWWLRRKENQDKTMLYLLDQPVNCLVVAIDEHLIVLPSLMEHHDEYEKVEELTKDTSPDDLLGEFHYTHAFEAPKKMELLCDGTSA
jgi:hypothetical protein